jgi:serine/threonine-protein kinase
VSAKTYPPSLGKYDVRGTLGRGAMGVVYDGWDPVIHRRVAIKTLNLPDSNDPEGLEGLERFKREAQAAGRLTHPNIVGVFDYGETSEVAYIVMEFVEGKSLKDVLGSNERMAPETAIRLMEDILAGLAYSHDCGVVHRDIKPANIMITNDGRTKIADFGIARIEASSMTQAGTVLGTPAYMSPEQFMGQVVDRRTDIYSSGVLLYQLLTGERPFEGSMSAIMHKSLTTVPPRPSELSVTAPASLDAVVARAMARRPEDRFATATEFAQALRQPPPALAADPLAIDETIIASAKTAPARAAPAPSLPRESPIRPADAAPTKGGKRGLLIGGGAVLVIAIAAAIWLLLPGRAPAPTVAMQASTQQTATPAPTEAPRRTVPSTVPLQEAMVPSTPQPAAPVTPPIARPPSEPSQPAQAVPPAAPSTAPSAAPLAAPLVAPQSVPPAVVPPVASPAPAAPPVRTAAAIQSALADSLPGVKCSFARPSIGGDGAVTLAGAAGAGAPEAGLHDAVDLADPPSVDWQIRTFDGPFCPALDTLRPLLSVSGRGHSGLDIALANGKSGLVDGEVIPLHVSLPDFAGYLHVAYLENDSVVGPLVPGEGYPAQKYAARASLDLGHPAGKFAGWLVGPPYGRDMIVAIASTAPLFQKALPVSESLDDYLRALQAALADLRRRGETATAAVVLLDTSAKR